MKPTTNGEQLFLLLRDELLESIGHGHQNWSNFQTLLKQIGGCDDFGNYFRGAATIHVMRRLLRYWEDARLQIGQESQNVSAVSRFIREDGLPGLSDSDTFKLARAVIEAERSSCQPITKTTRAKIINGRKQLSCYLCNAALSPASTEGEPDFLTLEHLWPQSIGGDSIENNLLPACTRCQVTTKDTISWEWLNIHNIVLPPKPSNEAIASVTRKGHFANYYFNAMRLADRKNISLKAAVVELGPMKKPIESEFTGNPITFFDLLSTE